MSLEKKILEKIEKDKIAIRPKWFFVGKDFFISVFSLAAISGGTFALGVALTFAFSRRHFNEEPFLLWLVVFAVLIGTSYKLLSKLEWAYKLQAASVVMALIFIESALGYLSFASGEAKRIEKKMEKSAVYEKIVSPVVRPIEKEMETLERAGREKEIEAGLVKKDYQGDNDNNNLKSRHSEEKVEWSEFEKEVRDTSHGNVEFKNEEDEEKEDVDEHDEEDKVDEIKESESEKSTLEKEDSEENDEVEIKTENEVEIEIEH